MVARDASLVLLALEAMVLALAPAAILYYVTRWLAGFLPRIRPFLRSLTLRVRRVESAVRRVMLAVARPFVLLHSLWTGIRGAVLHVLRRRH